MPNSLTVSSRASNAFLRHGLQDTMLNRPGCAGEVALPDRVARYRLSSADAGRARATGKLRRAACASQREVPSRACNAVRAAPKACASAAQRQDTSSRTGRRRATRSPSRCTSAWPRSAAAIDATRAIRALLITGAGDKAFAAGTDIAQFRAFDERTRTRSATSARIDRVLERDRALPGADHRRDGRRLHRRRRGDRRVLRPAPRHAATPSSAFPIARTLGNCLSMSKYAA